MPQWVKDPALSPQHGLKAQESLQAAGAAKKKKKVSSPCPSAHHGRHLSVTGQFSNTWVISYLNHLQLLLPEGSGHRHKLSPWQVRPEVPGSYCSKQSGGTELVDKHPAFLPTRG